MVGDRAASGCAVGTCAVCDCTVGCAVDADGNGDISLDEMIRKVVEIGKERKAIGNSMKDIGQALSVFDKVLLFVVLLIVIFIFRKLLSPTILSSQCH